MDEIDDLGRCENCGNYVLEETLKSVEKTEDGKAEEQLWCPICITVLEDLVDPNKPRIKRSRPWRITIKEVVSMRRTLSSASYPGMSMDEAIAWEQQRPLTSKYEDFAENLSYVPDIDLEYDLEIKPVV